MIKTKNYLIYLWITVLLSSCINLRYTDYGKPFDFLKAKNNYYKTNRLASDTANVASIEMFGDSLSESSEIEVLSSEPDYLIEKPCAGIVTDHDSIEPIPAVETKVVESKSKAFYPSEKTESVESKETSHSSSKRGVVERSIRPPGWWSDMWHAIWMFFLKWFLIILAAVIVLGLILWGIYALIAVLANPTVAGIVIACIVAVIWFLIEYS